MKHESIDPNTCPMQTSETQKILHVSQEVTSVQRDVAADLPGDEIEEEEDLLGQRQHQGAKSGDVGLQGVACNGHKLLGQKNTHLPFCILLLEDTAVAGITAAHMSAHHMQQLIPAGGLSSVTDQCC